MKLIAKTVNGTEYLHSRKDCAFVSDTSARKICEVMNREKFRLKENEIWFVYDYDFTMSDYCEYKLSIYKGIVKMKRI